MTRQEFESLYLGKKVRITFYDNEILEGELHNTQEKRFENNPDLYCKTNYYVLLINDNYIVDNLILRKSHIKKIEEIKENE